MKTWKVSIPVASDKRENVIPTLAHDIVAEVLARLHKSGVFSTDGMSQEAIDFVIEHAALGVELVLKGEE